MKLSWLCPETSNRGESGQLQSWSEPSEILNLRSSDTPETVALIPNFCLPLNVCTTFCLSPICVHFLLSLRILIVVHTQICIYTFGLRHMYSFVTKKPSEKLRFSYYYFLFLFFSGNTDLLCQNQVNIVVKPKLLWNFRFPRHLHPQFLQQQIRILHNLIKKFPSIHHNRKIN